MAKKELSDYSVEELTNKVKTLTVVTGILAGVLLVLLGVTIYESVSEGEITPLLATPFALSPIVLLNFGNVKKIKAEIERKQND